MIPRRAYRIAAKAIRAERARYAVEANLYCLGLTMSGTYSERAKRTYDELSEALEFFEAKKVR